MDDGIQSYRVLRLVAENYKRIKAADVTPGRNAVIVSGKNRQGKTSLLDSIAAALGGKKQLAQQPVRQGQESGQVLCILGDTTPQLLVKRVFQSNGKTALEITSAEGFKAPSPQAILDSLASSIAFDPLSFTRQDDRTQAETLRRMVGLDFSGQDKERKRLYDERTLHNKDAKAKAAQAAGIVIPEGTPEVPASLDELMAEHRRRQEHNRQNQAERDKVPLLKQGLGSEIAAAGRMDNLIADLESRLAKAKSDREAQGFRVQSAEEMLKSQEATVAVLEDHDLAEVQKQIVDSQAVNAAVAKRKQQASLVAAQAEAERLAEELTAQIDAIDEAKQNALAGAQWPVPGLGFDEQGVTYNGLPFSQASGAEQLEVSFAMSAALNPRLKVAIIRDASLLDEEQMAVVCKLAEQYDTQCWLEVVDAAAGPCGVLIEDGEVVSGGTPADAPAISKPRKIKDQKEALQPVEDEAPPF